MGFELEGTEAMTLEVPGSIEAGVAEKLIAGTSLSLELGEDGRALLEVLVFSMRGLGMRGLPGPRFDYGEALFRLGVRRGEEKGFLGIKCDIDHPVVRSLGAKMVRYPTREASITFEDGIGAWKVRVRASEGALKANVWVSDDPAPALPPRPLYVRGGEALYRVPWKERPAPFRRWARVEVSGGLGESTMGAPVDWQSHAIVHRGRVHRCGLAAPVAKG